MKKRVISALLAVLMVVTMLPVTALGVGNYGVNLGSAAYQTNVNPFFASGYGGRSSDGYDGECTWYAWGRAYEKLGVSLPCRGNATGWTTEAANAGYSTGTTARANSIMVEHYSPYGHVFFVEKVENGYAYVTEGNYDGYYHEDKINLSTMKRTGWSKSMNAVDYIYLSTSHTHSFPSDWTYDSANHWHKCTGCTEISGKAAHSFNSGIVTAEPTYYDIGIKTYTCTVCDYSYTEEIPRLKPSGYCGGEGDGSNLTWTLDWNTGVLTISGTGKMADYGGWGNPAPWCKLDFSTVSIGNGVTTIGDWTFSGCHNLMSVTIPDSVTTIGYYAFGDCYSLTSVTIPDNVTTIGDLAFCDCDSLMSVTIGGNVTSIGERAFEWCESLTSVTIPDNVTTIGDYAFYNCESLTSVTIGSSVTTIGEGAFGSCDSLTAFTVDSNNPSYSNDGCGVLFNKNKTELIQYPIGNLRESYAIPDNVTTIDDDAFSGCAGLTSITIPDSVTTIGEYALYNCNKLTDVYFCGNAPAVGGKSISFNDDLVLHCRSDKTGWTDTQAYDPVEGTWNNHRLSIQTIPVTEETQGDEEPWVQGVSYLQTEIKADRVVNYDGYASINLNGLGMEIDNEELTVTYTERQPQYALADQYGEFVLPYTNDLGHDYFNDNSQYYVVKDGLVSVQGGNYSYDGIFYNLDGTKAFELKKMLTDYRFDYETMDGYVVERREPSFVTLTPFNDGVAVVREMLNASWSASTVGGVLDYATSYLVDKSGNILYTFPDEANEVTSLGAGGTTYAWNFSKASEGKIAYQYAGRNSNREWVNILLGYIDYEGNKVIDLSGYHVGQAFSEGLAAVSKRTYSKDEYGYSTYHENYGYIDGGGNEVITCQFSEARDFYDGYAAVKKDGKWGYINKSGETVIPFEYDNAYGAGGGLFSVVKNGKCGMVNIENKIVVPFAYDDISSFEKGVAYAIADGKLVIIKPATDSAPAPVVKVSNVAPTGNIKVSWDAVKGASKYEVWRATSKTGTYSRISTTTKTSVTNTNNVTPGKTYYYKVRALDDKGNAGEYSEIKSRTCDYAQPTVSVALNADGNPKLTWKAVDGASKYEVWRATSKSGEYSKISTTSSTSVTNTKNLTAGTTYYYKVRAIGSVSGAASAYSTVVNCTVSLAAPVVKVTNVASTGKIKISWDAVEGAAKYEVCRATSKTGTYSRISTTTKTSVTNTSNVTPGKTYYYKVRALDANGKAGEYSDVKSRTCDCAQPVITLSNVASTGKIKVSWDKVSGAAKYEVYRATSKSGTYSRISTTTKTSVTNTNNVTPGKTYYYKVRAIGSASAATSAYSDVKSRTCDYAQPTVSVALSSGKPKLTWDKVDGASKYEVYRATSKTGTYELLKTTTGTSFTNTSAKKGTTYYYKVRAIGSVSGATSAYSTVVSIKATK